MNLANLGLSGINAAQHRLQTAGHNINNASTDGYNRQSVLTSTAGAHSTGSGFIGRGVQVDGIQRAYDNFLFRQLVGAQSEGASIVAYGSEIKQINNLFADRTVGVSPALQKFFDGIQAVASAPADPAARKELIGRASSLVGQLNDANAFLDAQRENINTQVSTVVTQINSYAERIRDLNQQIINARASGSGHPPNDLLDQRDQALTELNQLVGVRVLEQDGSFSLTVGNGQVLLGGDTVFPLQAVPSDQDPSRTVVAYTAPAGAGKTTLIQLPDDTISGGSLGGLLEYRSQALEPVQNDLGRLAVGLGLAVNELHRAGYDLEGNEGLDFFKVGAPKVLSNGGNTGASQLSVSYLTLDPDNPPTPPAQPPFAPGALTGSDYSVTYDGTNYVVTSLPNGEEVYSGDASDGAQFDGITFTPSGTAAAGDSWLIQPSRAAAGDLKLAITDPSKFAAAANPALDGAESGGESDGGNALKLAELQSGKVLAKGTMGFNEAFSQIVNNVGVMTQQNSTSAKAQETLIQQNFAAQQAVSGVNLNEEYVNLQRYQEQFRAAARLIDVSSTLFDTLLGMRA